MRECPHNELAYNARRVWCETCGADLDPNDTRNTTED